MPSDRRDIADEIELEVRVERRVHHICQDNHLHRVAVRGCAQSHLGGNIAGGARPVVDNELLAEAVRKPLAHDARDDVGRIPGRKADDHAHGPRRISLRGGDARKSGRHGGARRQPQETTSRKFHGHPLLAAGAIVRAVPPG